MRCIREFYVSEEESPIIAEIMDKVNDLIRNQEDIIDEIKEMKKELECLSDKIGTFAYAWKK